MCSVILITEHISRDSCLVEHQYGEWRSALLLPRFLRHTHPLRHSDRSVPLPSVLALSAFLLANRRRVCDDADMASTKSTEITYRKTRGGRWAVQGPAVIVRPGATVVVRLRNGGSKPETIESVGKTFTRDGVGPVDGGPARSNRPTRRRGRSCRGWDEDHEDCLSFGPCGPNCEYAPTYR